MDIKSFITFDPGVNVFKLFYAARMLLTSNFFYASLILVSKVRDYPSGVPYGVLMKGVSSWPYLQLLD